MPIPDEGNALDCPGRCSTVGRPANTSDVAASLRRPRPVRTPGGLRIRAGGFGEAYLHCSGDRPRESIGGSRASRSQLPR